MDNKNSKSESYAVREAENIINNYLRDRELCDIKNYYHLKEKYQRLKVVSIALFIVFIVNILLNAFLK